MSSLLGDPDLKADLSGYYIIKKFRHGWMLGQVDTNDSRFFPREDLIKMGYLADTGEESDLNVLGTTPPSVIVVPTSPSNFRKRSKSLDKLDSANKKIPVKIKNRADKDPDWRKNKDDPSKKTENNIS